jgi:hypothetical protein
MMTVSHPSKKGYRTIRLPLDELEYDWFIQDRTYAKNRLEELYEDHPELFPEAFGGGMLSTASPSPGSNSNCGVVDFVESKVTRCSRWRPPL